jgi:hypothetical protein
MLPAGRILNEGIVVCFLGENGNKIQVAGWKRKPAREKKKKGC